MKIVFLSYYSGKSFRGVETYVHELANRLAKANFVEVFQSGPVIPKSNYLTKQLDLPLNKFNLEVFKNISSDVDIIIPTNGRFQAIFAKIWCLRHPKSHLVISGQSGPGWDDRLNLICFPDKFIALTKFQNSWAKKANPFVSTSVIPNGVDLTQFNPEIKPSSIRLPHPIVLYVAALEPIKRHKLLIEAISRTQASLLLVGQGSLHSETLQLSQQLLGNKCKIMSVPYQQMPGIYTTCDLFVYPTSSYESFGIAMLEAMASGLPVVATDDPIRREIVGKSGWFADPQNIPDFADTLKLALSRPPEFSPLKQAAKFSWDKITDNYSQLFQLIHKNIHANT